MKKKLWLIIVVVIALSLSACSTGGSQAPVASPEPAASPDSTAAGAPDADSSSTPEYSLSRPVEFMVSSKAGGNSDLFSRTISDIITQNEWTNQPVVVQNNADGNGQISRRNVADSKTPNESLLCLSSGDLTVMVTSEGGLSIGDFRPIAILGADKQLILANKDGSYATMEEAIEAAENGQQITVGGTPGDELKVLNMMLEEIGLEDKFDFVSFGSSAETVTALLGGHVDLGLGKPAAAKEYVVSGDLIPVLAFSTTRFPEPFDAAPILSELGYNDVELPLYRGVVGPKDMSDEALAYWDNLMGMVAQSPEWQEYLNKSLLVGDYKNAAETKEIYEKVAQRAVEGN